MSDVQQLETSDESREFAEARCSGDVLNDASQKLKVCGHPVRLKLLCTILRQSDPCVSELRVSLNQPQPVISQHLAVLKNKGIVRSQVMGNKRIYSIVDPFIRRLVQNVREKAEEFEA